MNAFAQYLDMVELSESRDTIQDLLENSKNQKEFIAGAKKVWSKYRSSKRKVIHGRPSVWKPVISAVKAWYKDNKKDYKFQKATDYQLIQHVLSKHPELGKDAVRKYVKLDRLSWTSPLDRSPADWRFLHKHVPFLLEQNTITNQVKIYSNGLDKPVSAVVEIIKKRITDALQK